MNRLIRLTAISYGISERQETPTPHETPGPITFRLHVQDKAKGASCTPRAMMQEVAKRKPTPPAVNTIADDPRAMRGRNTQREALLDDVPVVDLATFAVW